MTRFIQSDNSYSPNELTNYRRSGHRFSNRPIKCIRTRPYDDVVEAVKHGAFMGATYI